MRYDELSPVFDDVFGSDRPQTLILRSDRAQTLTALSRYAECETQCTAVVRSAAGGTGRKMPYIAAAARNGLIYAPNGQGCHQEVETLSREALGVPQPRRTVLALRLGLARSLDEQGRHDEALAEAERAARLRSSLPAVSQHPETGAVELATASAFLGPGRGAEVRRRASAAHDACLTAFGPDHHRITEALELIGRIDGIRPGAERAGQADSHIAVGLRAGFLREERTALRGLFTVVPAGVSESAPNGAQAVANTRSVLWRRSLSAESVDCEARSCWAQHHSASGPRHGGPPPPTT